MTYYPDFARLLNHALRRQDRSASWLAQRLGVSPSTVGRWLNDGVRPGSPELVAKIADILGRDADIQALLAAAGYGYTESTASSDSQPALNPSLAASAVSSTMQKLPLPPTPLVGRQQERRQLAKWFTDPTVRLVTIVGPGGMGKTRLALAAAQEQLEMGRFEHGVVFVDLAPLNKADQMPAAIAQALGLPLDSGGNQARSAEKQIIEFLEERRLLIVLDNAEHLADGVDLIAAIVRTAVLVRLLVTSRVALRLPEEQLYPLDGLGYAQDGAQADVHELDPAATLFLQAARRVRPSYKDTESERARIAEICKLVEGMPLAIELAASWIRLMSAADILDAIRESLHFLETDLHGVPARHRSMEAVFDATWQRLKAEERQTFAEVSIFRGGFTANAARAVTGSSIAQLRRLAASSLIAYDHDRGRYTIHELLRQFAALRLDEAPDRVEIVRTRHSDFYLDLLYRRQNALKSRALQSDLQVLDAEIDNLSQAWKWATANHCVEGIAKTLDGLGLYLRWRGRVVEGETAFHSAANALRCMGHNMHYIRALAWQSTFTRTLGKAEDVLPLMHESLQRLDAGDAVTASTGEEDLRSTRAFVLLQMGALEAVRDTNAAEAYYRESLALFTATNESWFAAEALLGLGHVSLVQGEFDRQRDYVQQALDTYRTLGNVRGTASALSMLADIDSYRGRLMSGLELGHEALMMFRSMGDAMGTATSLARLSMTYMNLGDIENARDMANDSLLLFKELGSRRDVVIVYAFLCAIGLMAGEYAQALANAERSLEIADTVDDQFVQGVAIGFRGWAQQYNDDSKGALKTLREAITITTATGAAMDSVRWYSQLAYVEWRNGQDVPARYHCYKAVQIAAEVTDPWSLLTAISTTTVILSDGEDPALAVTLHCMLMQDPLCTASQWYVDGIMPHVEAASRMLTKEQLRAAKQRGADLKQQEEITRLRDKLASLGWPE